MKRALLFCNVGWMENYEGLTKADKIIGGGQFVKEHGRGYEVCNFANVNGRLLGYVQAPRNHVRLERLGADYDDESVHGIDVVFTARRPGPNGRSVVIGWYRNATVYRYPQSVPKTATLHHRNQVQWYRLAARRQDCQLLPPDQRTLRVPRGRNGMGNANVWFADRARRAWLAQVRNLIKRGVAHALSQRPARGKDPEHNAQVELAAVRAATRHFKSLGYAVESVERQNKGWDLEATRDDVVLLVEVKGLSGDGNVVELTPNEYRAISGRHKFDHRLCVVQSALTRPALRVFRFNRPTNTWTCRPDKGTLTIQTKVAAVIRIVGAR